MKNMTFTKKWLLAIFAVIMLLAAVFTVSADNTEESAPTIDYATVVFADAVDLRYLVNSDDEGQTALLVWTSVPENKNFTKETANTVLTSYHVDTTSVPGKTYKAFTYDKVAARQMGDTYYVRALYTNGETALYSKVVKYSVQQYAKSMLGLLDKPAYSGADAATILPLLESMLNYGANAQLHFHHNEDRLVNASTVMVKVVGGTLAEDGLTSGIYYPGDTVNLTAPETDADGKTFAKWIDGEGVQIATEAIASVMLGETNAEYTAVYESTTYSKGLAYTLSRDGTYYTVSGIGTCTDTDIVIPATYESKPVTAIGASAFYGCVSFTGITIPESITSIGYNAFYNCHKLIEVCNNSSLNIIQNSSNGYVGYYARHIYTSNEESKQHITDDGYIFYEDSDQVFLMGYVGNETKLTLPVDYNGKTYSMYQYAFAYCNDLTSITIPDSVTRISNNAFFKCGSLTNINISDNVTHIGDAAFHYCSDLKSIYIPDKVTSLGNATFSYCSDLSYIAVGANNKKYHSEGNCLIETASNTLISGCSTSIIPDYVTQINIGAFTGSGITDIYIPANVTSIGTWAFQGCKKLTSIIIPDTVISIGRSIFSECDNLVSVTIPFIGYAKDVSDNTSNTTFSYLFNSTRPASLTNVTVTGGTIIPATAFSGWVNITSITIPDNITTIGASAFRNCSSLINFDIPQSVTSLGDRAFYNCSSLTNLEIPAGVTNIGAYMFYNCTGLTALEIPVNVTSIGQEAFRGCIGLTNIDIPQGVSNIAYGTFYGCTNLANIKIPDSVTTIGESAFYGCTSFTNIVIPNSVTSIGKNTFKECNNLTSLTIPFVGVTKDGTSDTKFFYLFGTNASQIPATLKTVTVTGGTSIPDDAFCDCTNLTSVSILDGVVSIGSSAFFRCSALTSITLPDSLISIGNNAFGECQGLTTVTLPDSVTSIGDRAFKWCSNLSTVNIPSKVTSIGSHAFDSCPLTNIDIPDGVTSIGEYAFYWCFDLTSIDMPSSITNIGAYAFASCKSLTTILYGGTEAEWAAITKGSSWDKETGNYTVLYQPEETTP